MEGILIIKYSKLLLLGGLELEQVYDPKTEILTGENPYENKRYFHYYYSLC